MEKIIKKDGYVYAVENWWNKGFESYYYLGKDPDDPRWSENEENKQKKSKNTKKEVD